MVLTVHRVFFFFFNHPAPTEIYTLSLHDALPISHWRANEPWLPDRRRWLCSLGLVRAPGEQRSEPGQDRKSTRLNSSHTVISYAVFCLKKKKERKALACDRAQRLRD